MTKITETKLQKILNNDWIIQDHEYSLIRVYKYCDCQIGVQMDKGNIKPDMKGDTVVWNDGYINNKYFHRILFSGNSFKKFLKFIGEEPDFRKLCNLEEIAKFEYKYKDVSFHCSSHGSPRTLDWCEINCPKYYTCCTVAEANDDLKKLNQE